MKIMEKPNLDRLWRVWIKIDVLQGHSRIDLFNSAVSIIRSQVTEVVSVLETRNMISWYYFLVHGRNDNSVYFDVVFSLKENVDSKDFLDLLATYSYCQPEAKPLEHAFGETIGGIEKSLLKNEDIREAWRIIGKQSECIIDFVNIHKGEIPIQQFTNFMHFYTNPMTLAGQSLLLLSPIFQF